ncbi:hypothetical protein C8F04DRAFT_1261713 [Mycena alexandri]|uniref:Uncharacterized protein n=1 Tax=Mycena alexandri TaxID=1745969 RepID=A0AAD6X598_9AGAR|nr:hypothetical protein C8F04DRAFT_1261713 [Mycena alexandri]
MPPGEFSKPPLAPDSQSQPFTFIDFSVFLVFNTPTASQIPFCSPIPALRPFSDRITDDSDYFPANPFEPRPITAAQFNAANTNFEQANERADVVLSANKERADKRDKAQTLGVVTIRGGGQRRMEEKENIETEDIEPEEVDTGGKRVKYTGPRLIVLARAVVNKQPFLAAHKTKGATWNRVVKRMRESWEFSGAKLSMAAVQQKAEKLVKFKKNPTAKANKKLANIIGTGTSSGLIIGALLEQQHDNAKDKSDEAKEKIKQKNNEDRDGGEAIREASMNTMRKRRREPTPNSDDEGSTTDTAVATTLTSTSRATAPSSSIETIDSDAEDKPRKCKRRCQNPLSDAEGRLVKIIERQDERRQRHEEKVEAMFDRFVDNNERQKNEYMSLLKDFIAKV